MNGIFISYRREDSEGFARSLFQSLTAHYGADQVFMDVEDIELGLDFVEAIDKSLGACDVLLVLIGKDWLSCTNAEGRRRLDDPEDFVRIEVASALRRNIRVIPVLVRGGVMPKAEELPEDLQLLTRRQALELRHDRWNSDIERLEAALDKMLGIVPDGPAPAKAPKGPPLPPAEAGPAKAAKPKRKKLFILGAAAVVGLLAAGLIWMQVPDPMPARQQGQVYEASPVARPEAQRPAEPFPEPAVKQTAPARAPERPRRRPEPPDGMVMQAQELLTELGYGPGPVDGRPGAQTSRAVRTFQQEVGMQPDGRITEGLIERLTEVMIQRQEAAAAGGSAVALDMSGTWYDDKGLYYVTVQSGNMVRQEAYFTLGGAFVGRVEGVLNGHVLNYRYGAFDGSMGEGRGVVSEDGNHMEYVVTNLVTGIQESGVLHRNHLPH